MRPPCIILEVRRVTSWLQSGSLVRHHRNHQPLVDHLLLLPLAAQALRLIPAASAPLRPAGQCSDVEDPLHCSCRLRHTRSNQAIQREEKKTMCQTISFGRQ